jgi:hypothetical protein
MSISGLPTLLSGVECVTVGRDIEKSMTNTIFYLNTFYGGLLSGSLGSLNMSEYRAVFNHFQQQLANLSKCLLEYEQLLDSLNSWLSEVTSSLSTSTDELDLSSASTLYSSINSTCYKLESYLANYLEVSLQPLVRLVSQMSDTPLSLDDVESAVFSSLNSINDNLRTSVTSVYDKLFVKFGQINNYMNNTDKVVDKFLRGLGIWRYPYINLEKQQVG